MYVQFFKLSALKIINILTATKYWLSLMLITWKVHIQKYLRITWFDELKELQELWNVQIWSKNSDFGREKSTNQYCPALESQTPSLPLPLVRTVINRFASTILVKLMWTKKLDEQIPHDTWSCCPDRRNNQYQKSITNFAIMCGNSLSYSFEC